jgi:hypothetical protein
MVCHQSLCYYLLQPYVQKKIDRKFGILVQNMVQNMPIHLRY